jgi:transcriptional regulator with XRE-family HTH domain
MRLFIVSTIGSRVREARIRAEMNQTELGEASGISQQMITKIEADGVKKPSGLEEIANALGVSYSYLKTGVVNPVIDSTATDAESYILTAKDALAESLNSMCAINIQNGVDKDKLDKALLGRAFEISLRGKLSGDYLTAALGMGGLKKAK